MKYANSALILTSLITIGSISAMEKKQQTKSPQPEYLLILNQLRALSPSKEDIVTLESIKEVADQKINAAKHPFNPNKPSKEIEEFKLSGKLTQKQTKDLQSYLKSEVDKNVDAMIKDIFSESTTPNSSTIKKIAKNCMTKFPKIQLGDFGSILLENFNFHPKVARNYPMGGRIEVNKRETIANAWFAAKKELSK